MEGRKGGERKKRKKNSKQEASKASERLIVFPLSLARVALFIACSCGETMMRAEKAELALEKEAGSAWKSIESASKGGICHRRRRPPPDRPTAWPALIVAAATAVFLLFLLCLSSPSP